MNSPIPTSAALAALNEAVAGGELSKDAYLARALLSYNPATGALTWKTRGAHHFATVADASRWNARWAGKRITTKHKRSGYLRVKLFGQSIEQHRVIWLIVTGDWPTELIDHRNGVKDDNRRINLRPGGRSLNAQNLRRAKANNKSGLLGVKTHGGGQRPSAHIHANGVSHYLGTFDTPELAHAAYVTAKRQLHAGCTL